MAARDPGYKDRFCGSAGTQLQICQGVGPWFPSLASVGAEQEAGVRSRCPGCGCKDKRLSQGGRTATWLALWASP